MTIESLVSTLPLDHLILIGAFFLAGFALGFTIAVSLIESGGHKL